MNKHKIANGWLLILGSRLLVAGLGAALIPMAPLYAAEPAATKAEAVKMKQPAKPKSQQATAQLGTVPPASTIELAPQIGLAVGKSTLLKLPEPMTRISVGNAAVADVMLLNPREVYLLGKSMGSTNVILWSRTGKSTAVDVNVGADTTGLQGKLQQLLPGEKNIRVDSAGDSVVLSGNVSDAVKVDRAVTLAAAYSGKKVVNFLQAGSPQQVMLEVKVAEVDKTLLDRLGVQLQSVNNAATGWSYNLLSNFVFNPALGGSVTYTKGGKTFSIQAQKDDTLVKILAEPTIMAMSGQEGAFQAGGKLYIPVPQTGVGGTTITLEEKEFGVGLKFTPFVLEDGRINLKVSPEVSELGQAIQVGNQTLPTITTRRASTTVQLSDGQSFAIGGLIKNNVTETVSALPLLGEIPILGALFRSSAFQQNKTELLFVVTPRLVKPLPPDYVLPTDGSVDPSRTEFFLGGKMEGAPKAKPEPTPAAPVEPTTPATAATPAPATPADPKTPAATGGGFQMK